MEEIILKHEIVVSEHNQSRPYEARIHPCRFRAGAGVKITKMDDDSVWVDHKDVDGRTTSYRIGFAVPRVEFGNLIVDSQDIVAKKVWNQALKQK